MRLGGILFALASSVEGATDTRLRVVDLSGDRARPVGRAPRSKFNAPHAGVLFMRDCD